MGAVSAVKKVAKGAKAAAKGIARDPRNLAAFGLGVDIKSGNLGVAGQAMGAKGLVSEGTKRLQEEGQRGAEAEALASQQAQNRQALRSAESVASRLASDPTAEVSGSVSGDEKKSKVFSSILQGIEQRRAQILGSKSRPGRRSTILTR